MLSGSLCTLFGWVEEYHPRFVVSEHKIKKTLACPVVQTYYDVGRNAIKQSHRGASDYI